MDILSICSGIGGLDLGIKLAIPEARIICYLEREIYSCEILAARMQDGTMDPAPVWSDVRTFDGSPWRGKIDGIISGFPCQPWSLAGKRLGTEDQRWLWNDIERIIREVDPRFCFFENVPGLLAGDGAGIRHVLGSLAALGFDAEWGVFSAGEIGAGHKRERVFILAHPPGVQLQKEPYPRTDGVRCSGPGFIPRKTEILANGIREGLEIWSCEKGTDQQPPAIRSLPIFPPGPNDRESWGRILATRPDLAPTVEPSFCGMADGVSSRLDRLRALGNGVVPAVAARAWRLLIRRFENGQT